MKYVSFEMLRDTILSPSISIFQPISGRSTDRSRTFPLPVSRREHRCGTHRRAINQSADILVPAPNLWTGIQGSSGVCDPLECAPASRQTLSASAHARLSLFRSSITNGCNCGADRPLNRLPRQSNLYLDPGDRCCWRQWRKEGWKEERSSTRAGWWNWTRGGTPKTFPRNGWCRATRMYEGEVSSEEQIEIRAEEARWRRRRRRKWHASLTWVTVASIIRGNQTDKRDSALSRVLPRGRRTGASSALFLGEEEDRRRPNWSEFRHRYRSRRSRHPYAAGVAPENVPRGSGA